MGHNNQHSLFIKDSSYKHEDLDKSSTQELCYDYVNQQCCCFNMRKVMRAATQYYDRVLESVNIRSTQFTLLIALASSKAKTLTDIAEVLVMDRTTLTRNLKPLAKMGLIVTVNSRDKRSKAYALTPAGTELVAKCIPLWQKAQDDVINSMGIDNYRDLFAQSTCLLEQVNLLK